jgi:hypothetical protein
MRQLESVRFRNRRGTDLVLAGEREELAQTTEGAALGAECVNGKN